MHTLCPRSSRRITRTAAGTPRACVLLSRFEAVRVADRVDEKTDDVALAVDGPGPSSPRADEKGARLIRPSSGNASLVLCDGQGCSICRFLAARAAENGSVLIVILRRAGREG